MTMSWSMLRLALTLSAVAAFAPQSVTKQGMRSAQLQQPRPVELVDRARGDRPHALVGRLVVREVAVRVDAELVAPRRHPAPHLLAHARDDAEQESILLPLIPVGPENRATLPLL